MSVPTNPNGPPPTHALVRLRGEGLTEHRALLLWAMMGPRRTMRGMSVMLKRSTSTVRGWAVRYEWEKRYAETENADSEAFLLYERRYLSTYGTAGIVRLLENVVEPLGFLAQIDREMLRTIEPPRKMAGSQSTNGPRAERLADESVLPRVEAGANVPAPKPKALKALRSREREEAKAAGVEVVEKPKREAPPPPRVPRPELTARVVASLGVPAGDAPLVPEVVGVPAPAAPTAPRVPTAEERRAASDRRDVQLIDALLGTFAKRLAADPDKIKIEVRDLPLLLKTKRLLQGGSTENVAVAVSGVAGPAVVPTVRTRQAEQVGTEDARIDAMQADVDDIGALLQGIKAGRERDRAIVGEAVTTGERKLA